MNADKGVYIGLIGLGVIGSGVAKILKERSATLTNQIGVPLILKRVADLDTKKKHSPLITPKVFTADAKDILNDPEIDIVIELIGGENPAKSFITEALKRGKHVITANKEVLAKHGSECLALAREHKVSLLYEASVGGGIPLIDPLKHYLQINNISAIYTIINGTTNYILTRMEKDGLEFPAALKEAQELGYAESDPSSDIEGFDAAYKIAILASIAFHTDIRFQDVYHEGISKTAPQDFRYARELGYAIKLLAIAKKAGNSVDIRVHPVLIPEDTLLAKVDGVFNAVQIQGDLSGKVIFYGRGAGADPTANVVVSDAVHIARNIGMGVREKQDAPITVEKNIRPFSNLKTRYYIRMIVADQAGVLAQITRILGENLISISSAIQKESYRMEQTAEIVITTHPSLESSVQQAIRSMEALKVVKQIGNVIRVEDIDRNLQ